MYGAIIGDIAGSKYEFIAYKNYPKTILDKDCFFTDDTIMTVAIADALLNNKDLVNTVKAYGLEYPNGGYGGTFNKWLTTPDRDTYFSYGNGAAMRVSAAAWLSDSWSKTMDLATKVTAITHNHPEGIKGAQATATCIYMARKGFSKEEISDYIEHTFDYDLKFTLDEIRPFYTFNEICQGTVPQAIVAFLESKDFEDAIKLAISLGGDADTLAAITGSIAEAYYGIPDKLIKKVKTFIPQAFVDILEKY